MTNYTTLQLIEAEIRASTPLSASTTPTSTMVATWIQEASNEIELHTGELFSSTTESSTLFDYDGSGIFMLPYNDVLSVDKVEYNTSDIRSTASWITLQEGGDKDYITYLEEGEIHFTSGLNSSNKIMPLAGKQRFRISYKFGYNGTPLYVQRLATLLVAKRILLSLINSQSNTEGGTIQIGTIRITDPSNYGIQHFNNLNDEIDRIYADIGAEFNTFRITRVYDF